LADVKWIKIVTDIFDDEKILLIETLPEADSIIVIWFKLLCLAGKQNNSGVFILNDKMPYSEKMFATIFRRKESTVQLALNTFEQFGMIEIINDTVTIPNWSKHQNLDQLEQRNEYMKNYMKIYREKQKLLAGGECKVNSKVNSKSNVSEADKIREDIDKNIEVLHTSSSTGVDPVPYQDIVNLYHSICVSYPKLKSIGGNRQKAISARWKQYKKDMTVFKALFVNAEQSDFLKGANKRSWQADFNWLMNDANMAKVLEGNYDNKHSQDKEETAYEKAKKEAFETLKKEGLFSE
jgi:predicted phage replisome organizer